MTICLKEIERKNRPYFIPYSYFEHVFSVDGSPWTKWDKFDFLTLMFLVAYLFESSFISLLAVVLSQ